MYEYFQVSNNAETESPDMDRPDEDEVMNSAMNNANNNAMNNANNNAMNDQQLSCKAALQDAMDKCLPESNDNASMNNEDEEESMPTEMPSDDSETVMEDVSEPVMDDDSETTSGDVVEGFQNLNDNKMSDRMSLLVNVLIMMAVFFLLSHYDTAKFLTKTFKGLKGQSLHLVMTLLFGIVYLVLSKYL